MAVKCIGIGNRIMRDDGIGIRVIENLSPQLKHMGIEVILGETDTDYALSKIEDGDFLFIIDGTYFNVKPGTITLTPIDKSIEQHHQAYSQHQASLAYMIKTYGKTIEGFIIGIEVEEIDFSLELSNTLQRKLPHICEEVYQLIYKNIRGV
ncbi:hydrogenase maturation protease [Natronincola ferrireducens]|uniref:Hydrogenase maturation protease n=1 Tax=Natronincola ferrireducens TaxID=393762 RepID=A0A1G9GCM0_9FIRM|nr:hydrogenase maturation protease [Natronincola ferrireducens]SDK98390.1 hydrogenase maturation protease [Natronincola ferrireducens]